MTLENYITEAISRGRHTKKYHSEFPSDYRDKDGIIRWLEDNGYEFVPYSGGYSVSLEWMLKDHKKETGADCYTMGDFKRDTSKWIRILKGDTVYFIRTNKVDPMYACNHMKYTPRGSFEVEYDEIVKELSE